MQTGSIWGTYAADHGSGGDHNGEAKDEVVRGSIFPAKWKRLKILQGHSAQLTVLLGLTIVVVENCWLFLSLIHLLSSHFLWKGTKNVS